MCLIDIGGGTTDLAVWTQGAIRHTSVIPIAGDQITNDIAMALRTPTRGRRHQVQVRLRARPQLADRKTCSTSPASMIARRAAVAARALADVIQPRVEELFELIQAELRRSGFEEVLSSGIVLTGGSSVMPGMIELGEESSTCRCASAFPNTPARWPTSSSRRVSPPPTVCCSKRRRNGKRDSRCARRRDVKQVPGRMKSWF